MKSFSPKDLSLSEFHSYLLGAVTPRPVAFASSVDNQGNVNLSPFSFFNAFSANPPILVFSPSRRGKDNTTKHTYENIREVPEVVINIANYNLVEQMSLASSNYGKGVNEFVKAGLTEVKSAMVKPPRVLEAPIAFECNVNEVIQLGDKGGAGNLVICEILLMHITEEILDENEKINPVKLDAVGRLGEDWYCRVIPDSIFRVPKPTQHLGIGFDSLPDEIKKSPVLSGNNLARLAGVKELPNKEFLEQIKNSVEVSDVFTRFINDKESMEYHLHMLGKAALERGETDLAWAYLLASKSN
jgi:flavin reductase (DIM6/NTAB) family NADH-FMN oxidoreductase RutF